MNKKREKLLSKMGGSEWEQINQLGEITSQPVKAEELGGSYCVSIGEGKDISFSSGSTKKEASKKF